MALSPDGKRLATIAGYLARGDTSWTKELKVWDAETGAELFSRQADENTPGAPLGRLVYSPDGRFLAVGCRGEVRLMDAQTHAEVRVLRGAMGLAMAFSPDSKRLATLAFDRVGGIVKVWDPETGRETLTLRLSSKESVWITCLVFSPDGYYLAASQPDKVTIWDARPLETGP
jgi:WD40 repeat protein